MTRQSPRRPSTSRAPTSRPRRVAGQVEADATPLVEPAETPAAKALAEPPPVEPVENAEAEARAEPETGKPGLAALFDSRRATAVLVVLVLVLGLAAGGLLAWNHWHGTPTTRPSSQPVVMDGDDVNAGVDAAAKAAQTIITRNYQTYDKQVDEATALMTPTFAKKYRETTDDIKQQFVEAKTDLQARVVAQGVVHATRTEVQALVFLNEYASKNGGDTVYTPYRALVTVIHTDRGWLVSAIDTQ